MKGKINTIVLLSLIVGIVTIFMPSNAYACSCVQPSAVEEELGRSDAVFTGRVLKVNDHKSREGYLTKSALFEVNQIWKGRSESQIIIHTGGGGGDCGYPFEKGKEYVVYASLSTMYGDQEKLVSIICSRTTELTNAQEDLAILGEGTAPRERINLKEEQIEDGRIRPHPYVWVTLLGIVLLGTAAFFVWRRVRKQR